MEGLLIILLVLTVGAIIYPRFIKPKLEKKIKEMELELQKSKLQK